MATVTGTLYDCGLGHLEGKNPELVFTLSAPATTGTGLFATEPIIVIPETSGAFTVNLATTEVMLQTSHYKLQIRWLDASGNFVKIDFPEWKLFVPIAGGSFPDLIQNFNNNPFMVYWQATEPNPWPVGTVWVDTSIDTPTSGDVQRKKG